MRIGIVLPDLAGGGAERALLRLAGGLLERAHLIDLLLLRPTGIYRKAIPFGIRLFHTKYPFRRVPGAHTFLSSTTRYGLLPEKLPVSPWRRHRALWTLRRHWPEGNITSRNALDGAAVAKYLQAQQPDALLAALHPANVAAVCGRTLADAETPVVVSLHSPPAFDYSKNALMRAHSLYQSANAIVGVSQGVADETTRSLGLVAGQVTAIPNPIPTATIAMRAAEPVEHPWFKDDKVPVVLTVGRPVREKDHPTLVRSLTLLRRSTEARLAILCDPETSPGIKETQALADSLGVAEHVTHLAFDENPFRYMARAGAVVLSSRYEGLPNVLLEAMACGTAVASTNAPYGPAEILEGGRWGPLVPVGDAAALAKALARLLAGQRVASTDLQARAAEFSTEKAVNRYEKLFSDISR